MTGRKAWPTAILCLVLLAGPATCVAQLSDNLGGLTDENLEGYLSPLNTALSGTMNAAIFRTGYVPKMGVSISGGLVIMAMEFGSGDKVFVPIDPEGFTSLATIEVPTVAGDPLGVVVDGQDGLSQIYPGGFDLEGFEIAAPQISIGSIYGTRAVIRYIAFDLGDSDFGKFSYVGYGAQHSISQYFPGLPVDLAAGFMIQDLEIGDNVVDARATYMGVTASKDFRFLQPYVGLGIDTIQLDAKYDDDDGDDVDTSFDVSLAKETDPHLTLGVAAKIPYVSAFIELNAAAATGVAIGLSFGN
ncbi:MAG: hypothetical protein MUO70_04725 [Euryarchaeota archaeon]|nr:hypothetical protein [Euryarchaeota archaeon]